MLLVEQIFIESGRFCTRGRIRRLDELGQTFVVRLVMPDGHKTLVMSLCV